MSFGGKGETPKLEEFLPPWATPRETEKKQPPYSVGTVAAFEFGLKQGFISNAHLVSLGDEKLKDSGWKMKNKQVALPNSAGSKEKKGWA